MVTEIGVVAVEVVITDFPSLTDSIVVRGTVLGITVLDLCQPLSCMTRASHLTSLCFIFFDCKLEIIIGPSL